MRASVSGHIVTNHAVVNYFAEHGVRITPETRSVVYYPPVPMSLKTEAIIMRKAELKRERKDEVRRNNQKTCLLYNDCVSVLAHSKYWGY